MNELLKKYWPRTIWDFLALQLRIGLSLVILVPLYAQSVRLPPSIGLLLLICFGPMLALIYLVNRATLMWTTFLLLFSALGGIIGLVIAQATGSPFLTNYMGARTPDPDRIDHIFCASIVAFVFWWMALSIKKLVKDRRGT